ncbi:MAG: hypothetical protein K9N62_14800 [Verrucomicrobia bacterium]|nr:hypothetical protein [Verrucomicrobiota bacterium]
MDNTLSIRPLVAGSHGQAVAHALLHNTGKESPNPYGRSGTMKKFTGTCAFLTAGVLLSIHTANAVTLDFEGVSHPNGWVGVGQSYTEDGYELFNPGAWSDALVVGHQVFNTSGSDYYGWNMNAANNPVVLSALSGDSFKLHSLDVGAFSGALFDSSFFLTGHLTDGGILFQAVNNVGSFQNLTLNWANLARVEFVYTAGNFGAIDNLVITSTLTPTPDMASTLMLLAGGLMVVAGMRRRWSIVCLDRKYTV